MRSGSGKHLHYAARARWADDIGAEARFLQRVRPDEVAIDPPALRRTPALRVGIARADRGFGARGPILREPKLRRGQIEPPCDIGQRGVIGGGSDPCLMANNLFGKIALADFRKRKRGADVGQLFHARYIGIIGRSRLQPKPVHRQHTVERLGVARRHAQPGIDLLRLAARHIGARRPEVRRRFHLIIGQAIGGVREADACRRVIAPPPGSEPCDPFGLCRKVAGPRRGESGQATRGDIVTRQKIGPGDAVTPFGQRLGRECRELGIEDSLGFVWLIVLEQRHDLAGERQALDLRTRCFSAARRGAEPVELLLAGEGGDDADPAR